MGLCTGDYEYFERLLCVLDFKCVITPFVGSMHKMIAYMYYILLHRDSTLRCALY